MQKTLLDGFSMECLERFGRMSGEECFLLEGSGGGGGGGGGLRMPGVFFFCLMLQKTTPEWLSQGSDPGGS